MGFLGSLGRGFIRSAVNQVGRDYGKTISNSAFGDAHSTPIRNVSSTSSRGNRTADPTVKYHPVAFPFESETNQFIEKNGFTIIEGQRPIYSKGRWFFMLILLALSLLPYLGVFITIYLVAKSWNYLFPSDCHYPHKIAHKLEKVIEKVPDRRFTCGYKEEIRVQHSVYEFLPNEKDKVIFNKKTRTIGILHIIVPLLIAGLSYWHYKPIYERDAAKRAAAAIPKIQDSIAVFSRTEEETIYEGNTPLRKERREYNDVKLYFREDRLVLMCPYAAYKLSMRMSFIGEIYNKEKKKMSSEHEYFFKNVSKSDSLYTYEIKYENLPSQCSDYISRIALQYSTKSSYLEGFDMWHSDDVRMFDTKSQMPWSILYSHLATRHEEDK